MPANHMTATVRLNPEWAQRTCENLGGVAEFADAINADRTTIYRHLAGTVEAGPRIIGSVLRAFPIMFDDAFDVVDTPAKRRTYSPRRVA